MNASGRTAVFVIVMGARERTVQTVQWFGRSRSLTAGFLDGLQLRARRGITMTGSILRSSRDLSKDALRSKR
jgi:hypothetical protein